MFDEVAVPAHGHENLLIAAIEHGDAGLAPRQPDAHGQDDEYRDKQRGVQGGDGYDHGESIPGDGVRQVVTLDGSHGKES